MARPEAVFADAARDFTREVAKRLSREIKARTPVDENGPHPGNLRRGYRVRVTKAHGVEIVTSVRYWRFVEFGTSKMKAQPHIRPAIETVISEARASSYGPTELQRTGIAAPTRGGFEDDE